jgi:hypothetical protein
VSAPALAFSFFDTAHDVYGTARSGATILFEGRRPSPHSGGPTMEPAEGGWRADLPGVLELQLDPVSDSAELGGVRVRICRVTGTAAGHRVGALGTLAETHTAPEWDRLDALRSLSALVDERHGFLALVRRPRGALGHGEEQIQACLVEDGAPRPVEDARISTVYDGEGRQRTAGLELWLPGEELPHRGSGTAIAGSSLALEGLDVHTAVFRWRLDGREGIGAYELMARAEPPAAA